MPESYYNLAPVQEVFEPDIKRLSDVERKAYEAPE